VRDRLHMPAIRYGIDGRGSIDAMLQDSATTSATEEASHEDSELAVAQLPAEQGSPTDLIPKVEAVLISRSRPIPAEAMAKGLGLLDSEASAAVKKAALGAITQAVEALNKAYEATERAFRIETVAGGLRLVTLPEYGSTVAAFLNQETSSKLSRPAIETLAIIAYRQPVTRADIEAIRGVACGEVLRGLLERRLIAVTGRSEELGRPMLYGTTKQFLDAFGLASLADLPAREDGLKV
jgi:segregation and condensation protein B